MKRALLLIIVAVLTIAVLLLIFNPQVLEDVWLWVIGLIGPIVAAVKGGFESLGKLFKSDKKEEPVNDEEAKETVRVQEEKNQALDKALADKAELNEKVVNLESHIKKLESSISKESQLDKFDGLTLTVLRYKDDGSTSLGFLFVGDKYFCYTLEDTKREVKIPKETRIPAGTYELGFMEAETKLTKTYRTNRDWFHYHLHVKKVPDFTGIYIHSGSNKGHTAGCLLVADNMNTASAQAMIFNSRNTFERLYKHLRPLLEGGTKMRIKYFDEDWFAHVSMSNRTTNN